MDIQVHNRRQLPIQTVSPHEFKTMADFQMVNKLLRSGPYQIPDHLRAKALNGIESVIDDPDASPSAKVSAIRTMVTMDQLNMEVVKVSVPKKTETVNPKTMTDDELVAAVREVVKLLPPNTLPILEAS